MLLPLHPFFIFTRKWENLTLLGSQILATAAPELGGGWWWSPRFQLPSRAEWQPVSLHEVRLHRWVDTEYANEVSVSWKKYVSLALCNFIVSLLVMEELVYSLQEEITGRLSSHICNGMNEPPHSWHYSGITKRDQGGDEDSDGTMWWRGAKDECLAQGTDEQEDWSNGEQGNPDSCAVWITHRKQIKPWRQVQVSLFHWVTPGLLQPEATEHPLIMERLSCTTESMEELLDPQRYEASFKSSFGGAEKDTRTDSAECRFPTAQVNGLPVPKMQQAGIWQSQSCICQIQAFPTVLSQSCDRYIIAFKAALSLH